MFDGCRGVILCVCVRACVHACMYNTCMYNMSMYVYSIQPHKMVANTLMLSLAKR